MRRTDDKRRIVKAGDRGTTSVFGFHGWKLNRVVMEAREIKTKFHNLLDIIDDLTEAQQNRLNESIRQSDTGKTIPHETMKTEIKQWLTK